MLGAINGRTVCACSADAKQKSGLMRKVLYIYCLCVWVCVYTTAHLLLRSAWVLDHSNEDVLASAHFLTWSTGCLRLNVLMFIFWQPLCPDVEEVVACPLNFAPVCGSDGNTYANECALCAERQWVHTAAPLSHVLILVLHLLTQHYSE